jgi:NAD(P)-dependent dehydrogenase (short-subunit alcohol dehydrogenase family)
MIEQARFALVTGASAGIGVETALGLARAGYRVIMAGRDAARTEQARAAVLERLGIGRSGANGIEIALADFASLAAVRSLADMVLAQHDRLDLLVNNAGIIAPRYQLSGDGYELTIAVNHLAPFLLTNLLVDRLRASAQTSAPSRIVTVASQAHRGARLDLGKWMDWDGWSPLKAYGRSKLCNILFTRALARRLADRSVVAASLHPGVVATKIGDSAGSIVGFGWRLAKPLFASPEKGARTALFLATTPDPVRFHGAYLIDGKPAEPDPVAFDDALAERLWAESARLVGL